MHSLKKKKHKKNIQIWEKKKRSARRTKVSTFIVFLNPFIHLTESIHSSEKKNIKKYSYLEKKKNFARRTKGFDLYCVIGIVHPSSTKQYSDLGEEQKICEKNNARRTKVSTFIVFLTHFIYLPKNIHSL